MQLSNASEEDFYDGEGMDDEGFAYEGSGRSLSEVVTVKEKAVALTPAECMARLRADVAEVAQVLAWTTSRTLLLLRYYRWNKDRAKECFFDNPDAATQAAGVGSDDEAALHFAPPGERHECGACWDDIVGADAGCLSCRHWFCVQCWRRNLKYRMDTEGVRCVGASCLQAKCTRGCSEGAFLQLFPVGDPYRDKYELYLLEDYVIHNDKLCFCPRPACDNVVYCPQGRIPVPCQPVKCNCALAFCFLCKEEVHAPASCDMLKRWLKKEQDESETANWFAANTKPCPNPRCGKNIEKNGGCNHMTCPQCKHEWCWVCEGEWSKHGNAFYKCNYYEPGKTDEKRAAARDELRKYIHYYTRYRNHDQSKRLDETVLSNTRRRIEQELRSTQRSLSEVDYLEETALTLISCRFMLKYSYVYAYFLESGTGKDLFEYNQSQLEFATELLSEFIEDKTGRYSKMDVVNRTSTAKQMLKSLAEGRYDDA